MNSNLSNNVPVIDIRKSIEKFNKRKSKGTPEDFSQKV